MKSWIVGLALAAALSGPVAAESDGAVLRAHLQETYPSLTYVERYRRDYAHFSDRGRRFRTMVGADFS